MNIEDELRSVLAPDGSTPPLDPARVIAGARRRRKVRGLAAGAASAAVFAVVAVGVVLGQGPGRTPEPAQPGPVITPSRTPRPPSGLPSTPTPTAENPTPTKKPSGRPSAPPQTPGTPPSSPESPRTPATNTPSMETKISPS
ncbi:hypothetical protein ACI2LF_06480 [Kribbella sp. NPDC020789]